MFVFGLKGKIGDLIDNQSIVRLSLSRQAVYSFVAYLNWDRKNQCVVMIYVVLY